MASSYSTNLALELMATGEKSGTWGDITNTNLGTLVEQAISGYTTQAISDAGDTTITIPNGATGVARNMCIEMTGALTATRNLIVPANKKLYFIYNNTTGGYAVTVKVSGQTGVSVPNGAKCLLVSDGTDVVEAVTRVVWRTSSLADATSITPTFAELNTHVNTQAGGTLTVNSPGGSPYSGQRIVIRIKCTNVQTYSFNAIYRGSTDQALPTSTTGSSKTDYLGFIYNSTDAKWDLVSVMNGFT